MEGVIDLSDAQQRLPLRARKTPVAADAYGRALTAYRQRFELLVSECRTFVEHKRQEPDFSVDSARAATMAFFNQTPFFAQAWVRSGREQQDVTLLAYTNRLATQLVTALEQMRGPSEFTNRRALEVHHLIASMSGNLSGFLSPPTRISSVG